MVCSKRIAAALSIGVLVMMAMLAESSTAGVCNPNALYPCLSAIPGAHPPAPTRQCCNVVKSVDKKCMCNQLKSSSCDGEQWPAAAQELWSRICEASAVDVTHSLTEGCN